MIVLVLFSLFLVTQGRHLNLLQETNCGYSSCHPVKEGVINVHIVPHTHDDVGWLKTVDQYYYGSNTSIQSAGVQYILDSVSQELEKDPTKKFIYVETAFFWKWWVEQDDETMDLVRNLVNTGQLEFIGGAWSMNDEAASNYLSTVDQFTWGLRKLNDTFGECGRPKIGWQIDPFGHSKDMALIFAQLGFDGIFLGRIDYQDKAERWDTQTPEMVWRSSESLGESADIFTGVLYNVYGPPKGYCFDTYCTDDPIIDNPKSFDYNLDTKLDGLFDYIDKMAEVYTTSNVLITMGKDFHYQNARNWYKNLDKLIKHGNARNGTEYYLHYSTPSCYLKAVHDEAPDREWPAKDDDFFPYASDANSYWTGYFTSRPTSKRFEREANNFLQVVKQLSVLSGTDGGTNLEDLREAVGIMQHHDAITGTEKQHVANDYARLLDRGIQESQEVASEALNKLTGGSDELSFQSCLLTNISSCPLSEDSSSFLVTIYNPLSWNVSKVVTLPVLGQNYTVAEAGGEQVEVQLTPIPETVLSIPGRDSDANISLTFVSENIPALGYRSFVVSRTDGNIVLSGAEDTTEISFENVGVKLDDSGLLSEVTIGGTPLSITQNYGSYRGFVGDNEKSTARSSGAYIFRPTEETRSLYAPSTIAVYDGPVVKEIHQTFNDFTSQIIRINNFDNLIEFQWLVGPLPDSDDNGIEVVSVFQTDLATEGRFFTDTNGRQTLNRTLNERPTWTLTLSEPVAGNYYPVTSRIGLVDEEQNIRVAVLNDRAQGGSSLRDGEVELMVHRKCIHDDDFGVHEALNETAFDKGLVARGSHYLVFGPARGNTTYSNSTTAEIERTYTQEKLLQPWIFLSPTVEDIAEFSGLNLDLPPNVQILTLEPWKDGSILLRLEHLIEKNPESSLGVPVTVDLSNLFTLFDIISLEETTLGGNQWLEDNNRFLFRSKGTNGNSISKPQKVAADLQVTLDPMQIRTFVVEISRK